MNDTLLAFDIGTTGNKAALVNAATGEVIARATAAYPTRYTPDGGAEQSPDDWWASVGAACRELAVQHPDALAQVAAIGCGGMMNGVVLVDKNGSALRAAIIHADVRSAPQNRALETRIGLQTLFQATANRPDCHLTLPKLLWLREHEPEVLASASYVVQAKDYIVGRLTGVTGLTDPSDASLTGAFDVARREWVIDLWTEAGLEQRLLPQVVPSSQIIGAVTAEAAQATGLRHGTPVVMGGGDGACATAGSGVAPDEAYNYLGGTSWIGLNRAAPLYDNRLSNYCGLDDRVTVFGTVQAAGSSLEWFASACASSLAPNNGGTGEAIPTPPLISPLSKRSEQGSGAGGASMLDDLAQRVPPGARNLFFLPYLQGERAPLWDSDARGVFFGLATHHGRAELYRAVMEGVAYALNSILDVFTENGHPLPSLRLLGGGAKSELWRTILAGVSHRRLRTVADVSAATSRGAAMAAGVGAGLFPSFSEAARMVQIARDDVPDPALVAAYAPRSQFFATLYPALKERFAALSALPRE